MRNITLLILLVILCSCDGPKGAGQAGAGPTALGSQMVKTVHPNAGQSEKTAKVPEHVVIVVEENHSRKNIIGNQAAPYMNSLVKQGAYFTESYANAHPSQPNYLILFSGSDQGVHNDSCGHTFNAPNLASELFKHKLTFAGYSEGLPSVGSTVCTNKQYGRKHSPWVNFTHVPKSANMRFEDFPADYSLLPTVSFVIPNLDHDMHDGTIQCRMGKDTQQLADSNLGRRRLRQPESYSDHHRGGSRSSSLIGSKNYPFKCSSNTGRPVRFITSWSHFRQRANPEFVEAALIKFQP